MLEHMRNRLSTSVNFLGRVKSLAALESGITLQSAADIMPVEVPNNEPVAESSVGIKPYVTKGHDSSRALSVSSSPEIEPPIILAEDLETFGLSAQACRILRGMGVSGLSHRPTSPLLRDFELLAYSGDYLAIRDGLGSFPEQPL
jgi:hypothetical protein